MTEKTIKNITNFITAHHLIPQKARIVVGLSGGPDSVFLLHYLVTHKEHFGIELIVAAHLNHGWRADAHKDELFCKQLCETLGVPFVSEHLSAYEKILTFNGSKEAYARTGRRLFFQKVCKQYNAPLITLAHHLQDQEETFFIRLVRGTSLSGLTSMWPKKGNYIRPLLQTNKNEIVAYLQKHAVAYCTDPTNESSEFLRNRIRSQVLPALEACDNRFNQNFLATIERLQETELFLQKYTEEKFALLNTQQGIAIEKILAEPRIMQYRLVMHWLSLHHLPFAPTQSFLDEIIRFLQQTLDKTHTIHDTLHIKKERGFATIRQ